MPQTRSRCAALDLAAGNGVPTKQKASTRVMTPPAQSTPNPTPVSVSTRFNPEERDMQSADLLLVTQDQVYFYAHRSILLRLSSNRFRSLVPEGTDGTDTDVDVSQPMVALDCSMVLPTVTFVDYPSDVFNVVLHFIYGFSVQSYRPAPTILRATMATLFELGYPLDKLFIRHSEPYMLFLQAAAAEPLAMYAIAAQFSLESLAVAVSTFTLAVSPSGISDELAEQMGPIYLRRLFFLHLGRADALKRLLYPPPSPHPSSPDPNCGRTSQQEMSRIWALACASVVIQNHPNNLAKVFAPLGAQLRCVRCRQILHERVITLISEWGSIKDTI